MKWLDLKDINVSPKTAQKPPRMETYKTTRIHPQKYRLPKRYCKTKYREPPPLIDMFQDDNTVTIIAQIAGFQQDTLKINIKDQKLTLTAKAKDRRYYKSLNLPKVVIPAVTHTTFKNGVLEIKLNKATKQQAIKQQAGINDAA
jgi:HSP20 family molecular chaperone IbpA